MSKISEFVTSQTNFNTRMAAAIDGLTADVAALNAKILELQNTSGQVTPEDQALLDALQLQAENLTEKLEALDGMTPPVAPPVV